MKIERVEKLSTCPMAVGLALEGLVDLRLHGFAEESVAGFSWDALALVAWEGRGAVGVMVCSFQEWKRTFTIEHGYVRPHRRQQGVYRALWEAAVIWAKEKGAARVSGTTHRENRPMQATAVALGRELTWLTFEYQIPPEETP